jgi:hypothetical protein
MHCQQLGKQCIRRQATGLATLVSRDGRSANKCSTNHKSRKFVDLPQILFLRLAALLQMQYYNMRNMLFDGPIFFGNLRCCGFAICGPNFWET